MELMNKFTNRNPDVQQRAMLGKIGFETIDELIDGVVAGEIRLRRGLGLGSRSLSERELSKHIKQLEAQNSPLRSFIGMGYYQNSGSATIFENIIANPSWAATFPTDQGLLCQGRLEGLHNFQTMVASMTDLPAVCAALDEASAAASAMMMMYSLRDRQAVYDQRNVFFVDQNIFDTTLDILLTYSEPLGIEILCDNFDEYEFSGKEFGVFVQYPASNGRVCDYDDFCAAAHSNSTMVCAAVDLLALALLRSPGSWGADIAVGSAQRFGLELNFGGDNAGFIAARAEYKEALKGLRVEFLGDNTYNIEGDSSCQPTMAIAAGMYAILEGSQGILDKALHAHSYATALADYLLQAGYTLSAKHFFDTIEVLETDSAQIAVRAAEQGINVYCPEEDVVHISLDELTTLDEINALASIFAKGAGVKHRAIKAVEIGSHILHDMQRNTPFLQHEIFCTYNDKSELRRYIKQLELRDKILNSGMRSVDRSASYISTFSNPLHLEGFANMHPFAPADQAEGYSSIISKLEQQLCAITGFSAASLQPSSSAMASYTALMIIRAYHQSRTQSHRNIALLAESLEPRYSAIIKMAGMKLVKIACNPAGQIEIKDLKKKLEQHSGELSCLIVDYTTSRGYFEENIREIIDLIHDHRAQVFMPSSDMGSYIGLTSAGYIGADVCQIELDKIFELPSGSIPGLSAVCTAAHLGEFLPTHPIVAMGGRQGITAVSGSAFGRALLLPLVYAGIASLGEKGFLTASQNAILGANYLASLLKDEFKIVNLSDKGFASHKVVVETEGLEPKAFIEALQRKGYYTEGNNLEDKYLAIETRGSKHSIDALAEALIETKNEIENTK